MAMKMPKPEDTEMNMTPMIDIVFQLIVFFMLTLKFKSVDHRIESQLPKDRGLQATPQFVSDLQAIKVKLFRKNKDNPAEAYTKIKVGNDWETTLPKGIWTGIWEQDLDRHKAYETTFARLTAKIKEDWARQDNNPEVKGEIAAPPPDGGAVPHGDVVRVLDTFLMLGLTQINFEGAMAPLSASEGGSGAATGGGP
jgi:hypothetical protein